ncbi:molybdopterin-dependent oxidoreductase [Sodalis praecaptivus]|nr:molybdopterin-dependent oxidoreductase [Sodalis praecaptivus]
MTGKVVKGYCTLCRSRCGTLNHIADDRLIAVSADASHPTGQAMCLKGKAAPELVDSSERLRYPLRRTRPKGAADPGWQRISWDEALAELAGQMAAIKARSGAHAFAFGVTTPSGTPLSDSIDWIERLIRSYGSPNTCYATEICNWHKDVAHTFTFGCGMPTADYPHSDLIMLWGHNPANTWLAQAHAIGEGRRNGARLLVIDPRETALAQQADVWLRIRPGTDAALAMGLANLLLADGEFDAQFIRRWSNAPALVRDDNGQFLRAGDVGLQPADALTYWDRHANAVRVLPRLEAVEGEWDETAAALRGRFHLATDTATLTCRPAFALYARACAAYTPARTAALTWVSTHDLRRAADLLAAAHRVAYHAWSGVAQQTNATQTDRAIACLYALTGSFDAEGGNRIFAKPPYRPVNGLDLIDPRQREKALGYAERPLGPPAQGWIAGRDLYEAILTGKPYAIEGMLAFGTNILVSQGDTALGVEALTKLPFYAHCDLFLNPSAHYADIVLPVNTPWEREGLRIGFEISSRAETLIQLRPQMVSSRGEARSDNDIVFALANRLGLQETFFGGTLEQGWNAMLAPTGLTVACLRAQPGGVTVPVAPRERHYRAIGFATETGKVELYSERLLKHGYPPLPTFDDATLTQPDTRFPYVLTSAKNGFFCHSQHRSLASLRRKAADPVIEIAAALARQKGIAEQDWVRVTTRLGSARFRARLRDSLHPGVLVGEFGWWQDCVPLGQPGMPLQGEGNSHYNGLVDGARRDPISGATPLRAFACDVAREVSHALAPARWQGYRPFIVQQLHQERQDVTRVTLAPADGGHVPAFQPGQHVTLRVALNGEEHAAGEAAVFAVRAYSLIGSALAPDAACYHIAVRHLKETDAQGNSREGAVSAFINRHLRPGDRLELMAPGGHFVIPYRSPRPLVFYAGGIGITPFLSALETAADAGSRAQILLLYANRDPLSHAFDQRIAALQAHLPGLRIIHRYSHHPAEPALEGRLNVSLVADAYFARRALHYLCGPPAMMAAITEQLLAKGVARFAIFQEAFRAPAAAVIASDRPFNIHFQRSGQRHVWTRESGPLLSFAERLGIPLPSGCRVGQCESCAVRILQGEVKHLHAAAPDEPDTCLTCQAIPISDLTLDA